MVNRAEEQDVGELVEHRAEESAEDTHDGVEGYVDKNLCGKAFDADGIGADHHVDYGGSEQSAKDDAKNDGGQRACLADETATPTDEAGRCDDNVYC